MRIFVTGATGFIGAHFVERATADGHEVIGLYRSDGAKHRAVIERLRAHGASLRRGDVLKPESFADMVKGADSICHFAAAFRESGADESYFRRMNVEGTSNVARAAAEAGVKRFVQCGTAGIYGQRVAGTIDESTPIRPWNSYERSKLAADEQVREIATSAGMEYVILRPTAVYGPRDERLLKLFRSVQKGRFPLFGPGDGRRHMIYVTDLADAFLRACTAPTAANQELIVAGPKAVPLREMLETIARAANRPVFGPRLPLKPMLALAALVEDTCKVLNINPPIYRRRMDFYLNDAAFDSRQAQAVLGWQPKVDLAEGFAATLSALRQERASATVSAVAQAFALFTLITMFATDA
ncbi:NAD-dependent epimerase/dehydratase family protein [Peristeroidobacter agariperforans]|uniref:NAD-dependent epimerase/dehydratase family protein n=1 Tax=Peristeroidobacter agariperforans TaxID=268404 RepID=UPI00101DAA8E|nr:NAD-dependent epimerase/dehydratase family protein [Peristeroidobacter agariperforans]